MSLQPKNLIPNKGEVRLFDNFLSKGEADQLFDVFIKDIKWKKSSIWMFGRKVFQPRLTAWYADPGITYSYSGIRMKPLNWIPSLYDLKSKIEIHTGSEFNSVLMNLYRDGNDSMGWHRDNEKELGKDPKIASLSLGETRRFLLRKYDTHTHKTEILLSNGSLLMMTGSTQSFWEHSIPKSSKLLNQRINLTFRNVIYCSK